MTKSNTGCHESVNSENAENIEKREKIMTEIEMVIDEFAKKLKPNIVVLDVGCGRPDSQKQVDKYFDGLKIPLGNETVGAIICTEVLEHAIDHEILIAEMYRVLEPGGKVCITVPFIWGMHEVPYDFRRFTAIGLCAVVTKFGFEICEQRK
jgi:SAM-dependent methyltransferase